MQDNIQRFWTRTGFPQVAAAIDGSHIPIKAPEENPTYYFNRKGFYSVVLQALVDANGCFMDTNVGRPGCMHDARVFTLSSLYTRLMSGQLFRPNSTQNIEGTEVPTLILGDPAYPLLPNLMKCYPTTGRLNRFQTKFNKKLCSARYVVEHAFGRLKGRWRILNKRNDHQLSFIKTLVHACCTLHNICERNGDPFRRGWLFNVPRNRPPVAHNLHAANNVPAKRIRDALTTYFRTH